ncbi:MAG: hypothetical protein JXA89_07510 [Anaerolineae bacterium]|nr:hypothetical protein [Anaerolineae bacterium]
MSKKQARRTPSVRLEMPSDKTQQPADLSEYDYVITDLKRVAILAAAMFALLIALSFFIR